MPPPKLVSAFALACAMLSSGGKIDASTVTSTGAGSAVTSIDRLATFDRLDYTHNGTPLSDYTEGLLFISTDGDSTVGWGPGVTPPFNPFHLPMDPATQAFFFPDFGNKTQVTIRTTDQKPIYAIEFLYGNGWTTGDIYGVPWGNNFGWLVWQTLRGTTVVSSGQIGPNPELPVGTIVGWYDPDGFDELQVRCVVSNPSPPDLQELALDDVHVQLTAVGAYSAADASRALQIAAGLDWATPVDMVRLNAVGDPSIGIDDALWILRKTLGL